MIAAVSLLCFVAGSLAIPVPTDYYPTSGCGQYGCSNGHGAQSINGGFIGINSNGFESSMLGFDGGNSAAAASSAASGLGSAAAAVAAAAASRQQGVFGLNNGFNGDFGFNGGNSGAAAASAAASGMNAAAAAAAAAAAGSSGHGPFVGYQGATGQQLIGSYNGIIAPQGQYVQYPGVQQFGGFDGSASAASAAAAASQQGAAAAAAAAAGRNAAAASAAAAGRNAAAAAAAAASGAGMRSQFGFGGLTGSQFTGQIGGSSGYFPGVPVFRQNSGAAAAASAAASNNAAAAAAAAAASGSNGFINGGIIGGSSGIIGPQVVPGRKVY